jgi:hypothetical protein
MKNKKKFSISAIILIVLLALRFISQIFAVFLLVNVNINSTIILIIGIFSLLILFYGIALVGVINKTHWGINFALAIAIMDIIFTGILDLIMGTLGNASSIGAIVFDLILILLAGNIAIRIRKSS